jgi:uncharacterized membrane protein YedE/YeeE
MAFPKSQLKSRTLKRVALVASGALVGFGYYYFVGCTTGSCSITSNPWRSTAYGAMMGALLTLENRGKKGEKEISQKKDN